MEQTTLYYRSGASDKVYQASIRSEADNKYSVQYSYGRRGTTLQTGTKTAVAVNLDAAKAIYDGLIKEKTAKGYTVGENGTPYQHTSNEQLTTGIQCQLLNSIGDDEIGQLLLHPEWWMQEKFDGRRLLIQKSGEEIIGINRRGLRVALPETMVEDAMLLPMDCIVDGEAVGEQLHVFDLLRLDGEDRRDNPYLERFLVLMRLMSACECRHIVIVQNACIGEEKQRLFEELKGRNAEGAVFKHIASRTRQAGQPVVARR
jgi:bifunctional non-homologous end joining protein LigD